MFSIISSALSLFVQSADVNDDPPATLTGPDRITMAYTVLLRFLPPELVLIVVELSDLTHVEDIRAERLVAAASHAPQNDAHHVYLVSKPILRGYGPADEVIAEGGIPLRIKSVEYDIKSRDQGWCSDASLQGTYRGSSWFEAAILRLPDGHRPVSHKNYEPDFEVPVTNDENATRWLLQKNFCGSSDIREHSIIWSSAESPAESPWLETGAGDGDGFVQKLRHGDCIAVLARARYPGWVNHVESVKITVTYAVA
ncbi:unnamed protein product [Mycena citricolor]|uniref:Uncharacterized protein n=1 Tax=Mycena citricolor TaxID=2018698 RepID=A0AAD2HJE1_9AGAR|nr:unnamed protein product [Mycena citricolor]